MRIGTLHATAMTATPVLAAVGVTSGSPLLAGFAVVAIGTMLLCARRLLDTTRSKWAATAVHALTVLILFIAMTAPMITKIDAVLIIILLGIFNRFVLRGGHRDDFLVAGASAVLMSAVTTVTPGVTFFMLVLLFIPAILYGLWSSMLLGAAEREGKDPAQKMQLVKAMAARRAPRGLVRIAVLGFALTGAGYLVVSLLPRYTFMQMLGAGYFMGLPGSSPTMELHTDGVLDLGDGTPVLRVEPLGNGGESTVSGLYARVHVLDQFDGRLFKESDNGALYAVPMPSDRESDDNPAELVAQDTNETVRVTMNRMVRENHEHPLAVLGRAGPAELARKNVRRMLSGTWVTLGFRTTSLVYKARLDRPISEPRLPRHLRKSAEERVLEVPEGIDPRVVALGQELARGKETTQERVDAVLQYLARGFTYSLDPLEGTSSDPLVRFLFEAKQGHCELYAAALAVLLRVGGVKTRVASGYYGGNWNSLGGYLVFTSQDAHAWVEVLDESVQTGEMWTWIDATPEDLRSSRKQSPLQVMRDWWDAAETFWFDHVIDFDETKRRRLVAKVSDRFEAMFSDDDSASDDPSSPRTARSRGWVGLLLLVPAFAGIAVASRRRRRVDPLALGGRVRRALGAGDDENVTLGFLLSRVDPAVSEEARTCVARYEAWRFGAANDLASVLVALTALEAAKKRARR